MRVVNVLHVIDPGSFGAGPCTLALMGQTLARRAAAQRQAIVMGTEARAAMALQCGVQAARHVPASMTLPWPAARALRRAVDDIESRSGRVDLVHAWTGRSAIIAALAVPHVPRLSTPQIGPEPRWHVRHLLPRMTRHPARVLAGSDAARRAYAAAGIDPIRLQCVHPAIDLDEAESRCVAREAVRARWCSQHRMPDDAFVIGLMGEPVQWIDARQAVHAAARLALTGRSVRLVAHHAVAGRLYVQQFVRRLGLNDVLLLDDAMLEPWRVVRGFDVALLDSSDGGPVRLVGSVLPLMWAIAARVPVVVEAGGPSSELVAAEQGVLGAPPGDVNALADRLAQVRDEPALANRLADSARRAAMRDRDSSEFDRRVNEAAQSLIVGRTSLASAGARG